jgi:DNA primase
MPIGVATSGTAVTEHHFKLIKRYTDNVYMLFDNDEAGRNATIRALKIAYRENVFPKMIVLPDRVKDVDDLANEDGGVEEFKIYIEKAQDAFLQVYEMLRVKYDMSSPVDKLKLFNDMFSMIICVDNYTIQEHYKQTLAEKVGLPYAVINNQFNKYVSTDGKFETRKKAQGKDVKSWQPDRQTICAALFYDNLLDKYIKNQELRNALL